MQHVFTLPYPGGPNRDGSYGTAVPVTVLSLAVLQVEVCSDSLPSQATTSSPATQGEAEGGMQQALRLPSTLVVRQ